LLTLPHLGNWGTPASQSQNLGKDRKSEVAVEGKGRHLGICDVREV